MPEEPKPITPPVADPTEGKKFTDAELQALVEKARQEEKQKLYPDLEKSKTALAQAQEQLTALKADAEKNKELSSTVADLQLKLDAIEKAKTGTGNDIDVKKLVEEVAATTRRNAESVYTEQLAAMSERLKQLDVENRQTKLSALRQKIIAESNGEIISSLLGGNTEDEMLRSAEAARSEYAQLKVKFSEEAKGQPLPGPIGTRASSGDRTTPPQALVGRKGDVKDWKSKRVGALEALKSTFG